MDAPAPTKHMGREEEILTFLTNAWSNIGRKRNRHNITVLFGGDRFSANLRGNVVKVPKYSPTEGYLPKLGGISRYRVYRYLCFHESMHQRHTMVDWETRLSSLVEAGDRAQALHSSYNIVEDYRIDLLGTEEYRGMGAELRFYNDFLGAGMLRGKEKRLIVTDEDALNALFLCLWFGSEKAQKVYALTETNLHTIGSLVEKAKANGDTFALAREVYQWATSYPKSPRYGQGHKARPEAGVFASPEVSDTDIQTFSDLVGEDNREAEKGIREEYALIEKDSGREEDSPAKEYQARGKAGKILGVEEASPIGNYSALTQGNQGTIQHLKSLLQKWQIGWREVSAEAGEELDMEGIVSGSKKRFFDEVRTSPRGATYVLLDISGSIIRSGLFTEYKSALAIICEVFAFLGLSFEVSAYAGDRPMYLVKAYNEPWTWAQRAKLAGLKSEGGTPTASALELVSKVSKRHGIGRVFIITDGAPDKKETTKRVIRDMEHSGVKVYGIGIAEEHTEKEMYVNMDQQWGDRRRWTVITSLGELPNAFFWLMGTEVG